MVIHVSLRSDACEPQTQLMWLRRWKLLLRENKSGRGGYSPRLLSSFNHVRPASYRPLVRSRPSQAGAATNRRGFSGSAVQLGSQFSLVMYWNEPIFSPVALLQLFILLLSSISGIQDVDCRARDTPTSIVQPSWTLWCICRMPSSYRASLGSRPPFGRSHLEGSSHGPHPLHLSGHGRILC